MQPIMNCGSAAGALPAVCRRHLAGLFVLLSVAAIQLATVRAGHNWGDDFAQYILHGQNIATGRPYGDTGYLFNTAQPDAIGPPSYPPGYAFALSWIIRVWGLNLLAMKLEQVLFVLVLIAVTYALLRLEFHDLPAALGAALVGLMPFIASFKNNVLSDLLFVTLVYAAILAYEVSRQHRRRPAVGVIVGLLIYASYATRPLGGILVPAIALADLLADRRLNKPTIVACGLAACLVLLQLVWLPAAGYDLSLFSLTAVGPNVTGFESQLLSIWDDGISRQALWLPLDLLVGIFGMVGIWRSRRLQRPLLAADLFGIAYLIIIMLFPYAYGQGIRYLLPLLPLISVYVLRGIAGLATRRAAFATALVALVLVVSYGDSYRHFNRSPIAGPFDQAPQRAFAYVEGHTRRDAVLVSGKPRAAVLFTSRRAGCYIPQGGDDRAVMDYFRSIDAGYLLTGDGSAADTALHDLAQRHPGMFVAVWRNAGFTLYEVHYHND
jgi:hypothetical protein